MGDIGNPFAKPVQDMIDKVTAEVNDETQTLEDAEVAVEVPVIEVGKEKEPPLVTMQRILADYGNKESDIPVNCFEYWAARRAYHREANP